MSVIRQMDITVGKGIGSYQLTLIYEQNMIGFKWTIGVEINRLIIVHRPVVVP